MTRTMCVFLCIYATFTAQLWAEGMSEKAAGRPSTVTVAGLKGPTSVGMMQLLANPPAIEGTEFEFLIVPTPDIMVARITSGEVDMAAVPINLSAILYNKRIPIHLIAVTGDGVISVVSTRRDIQTVADLRGRTIYNISKNQTPDYTLRYILRENGIDPDADVDIRFDYSHLELAPLLIADRVDLAVLPEPFISIVRSKNPSVKPVIDLQTEWGVIQGTGRAYPTSAFIAKTELTGTFPELTKEFLDAYRASIEWVVSHPEEAAPLVEEYIGLPSKVMETAIPRLNLRFSMAWDARNEVDRFFEVLFGFQPKSIGGKLPDEGFYYRIP